MPPNPRVVKAFRTMRDLGISEDIVKPVLKSLLKLYDKNWDLIEAENYRVLADAIFDNEERKAAEDKDKLENNEDEAQELDEPGRPLKRLCLKNQGQASDLCNNSTRLAETFLITPKDEPIELPEVLPQNQVQSMVISKHLNNGNMRIDSQHVSCHSLDRSKGKQPVLPKPLTLRERTDTSQPAGGNNSQTNMPATTESVSVPHPSSQRNKAKEALSPWSASVDKRLEPEWSSQSVSKEKSVGGQILVQPNAEPFTGDTPVFDRPIAVIHQATLKKGDSSRKSYSGRVQNGSVPLVDSLGGKDSNNGVPATNPEEFSSQLEVASSPLGEVKICLSYNISSLRPSFQVPSLDAVVKLVEDRYLKSYEDLDPNFSLLNLMKDMCDSVLELGFESCHTSEETN